MTRRVVAFVAAPSVDTAAGAEFLRTVAAARAAGIDVALFETGRGVGVVSRATDLDGDASRYVEALAQDGVRASPCEDPAAALSSASDLFLLPDPDRPGRPDLLALRRGELPSADAMAAWLRAGQVVLV